MLTRWNRLSVAVAMLLLTPLCLASRPDPRQSVSPDELSPLVDWVSATGVVTVIRGHIAAAAGLGNFDVPVRQRAFQQAGAKHTDVIAVATDWLDVVLIARMDESDGSATVWRTSRDGRLEATVAFLPPAEPELIDISPAGAAEFAAVKRFLFQMMAQRQREERLKASAAVAVPSPAVENSPAAIMSAENPLNGTFAAQEQRRRPASLFGSEISALVYAPWAIIGIVIAVVMGCQRPQRRDPH